MNQQIHLTLTSMSAINEVVSMPVIRPLACFDKLDIIDIAKNIDTYETSILPFIDCCTIFVPKHPVINPSIEKCREYEELVPFKDLIYEAVKNHEMITIKAHEEERRLFYVALTRTKNYCYLFVPKDNPSIFVKELIKNYREYISIINL